MVPTSFVKVCIFATPSLLRRKTHNEVVMVLVVLLVTLTVAIVDCGVVIDPVGYDGGGGDQTW